MVFWYGGYAGSVEYDDRDKIFHGRMLYISDVIAYEGATVDDLEENFMDAVDSYLMGLKELGRQSEISLRTCSDGEVLKLLRKRRCIRRLYHKLHPKDRG